MEEDDFGGFEAAEPLAIPVTASIAASPSPWAVFSSAAPSGEPEVTTSNPTKPSTTEIQISDSFGQSDVSHEVKSDNVSDSCEISATESVLDQKGFSTVPGDVQSGEIVAAESNVTELDRSVADQWLDNLNFPPTNTTEENSLQSSGDGENQTKGDNQFQHQIDAVQHEKDKIKQELCALTQKHINIERDLEKCQAELAAQKEKYEEAQVKHTNELDLMRKAGLDAVAVIVEEYKELCKVTVLEQKLACEQHMKEKLKLLTEQNEEALQKQNSIFDSKLEEQRTNQEAMFTDAMTNQLKEQKSTFDAIMEEEKKSLQIKTEKSIQDQRESTKACVEDAVETIRAESKSASTEQKSWLLEAIGEKVDELKADVLDDLGKKQMDSQGAFKKQLEVDSEKAKEYVQTLAEKSKEEMLEFIHKQKQADGMVRQKQLMSLQLFLESAKCQVSDLLDSVNEEKPSSTSSL